MGRKLLIFLLLSVLALGILGCQPAEQTPMPEVEEQSGPDMPEEANAETPDVEAEGPSVELLAMPAEMVSGEPAAFAWKVMPTDGVEHTNMHTSFTMDMEERTDSEVQETQKSVYVDTVTLESDVEQTVYIHAHARINGENYKSPMKEVTIKPKAKMPTEGYALHIDAKRHIESDSSSVIHHYCKGFEEGFFECQLFDSDDAGAKLIGVEVVMGKEVYDTLSDDEQENWHHHEEEIGREEVDIQLPDTPEEEQGAVVEMLNPTYGKVIIFWDPADDSPKDPYVNIV